LGVVETTAVQGDTMPAEPPDTGGPDQSVVLPSPDAPLTTGNPVGDRSVPLVLSTVGDDAHTVELRHRLQHWLAGQAVSESCREDVVLGTYEAIANAVEHGYRTTVPAGTVTLEVTVSDGHVDAVVTDHGRWRPPPADPGYRGRGFALIDALAEHWTIDHDAAGTTVTIRFPRR
jgi:anti-sigma regulatory factor (Ser/Thr protein kinase)